MRSLLILLFLLLSVNCEEEKAEEKSDLEKCGGELEKLYNSVCEVKETGAKKLFSIRKLCFTYPQKVMKHKEIVEMMDTCNTEEKVCDKKLMSDCGREKFEKASEAYEKKAEAEKLEEKTLPEMFAKSQAEVIGACNETLICFQSKVEMKLEELDKELEKKKEEDEKKKKEEEEKKKE